MKALVVYDSVKGNTEAIAREIAAGLGTGAKAVKAGSVGWRDDARDVNVLVIGSPTFGGKPSPAIQGFLESVPKEVIRAATFAAFDTRLTWKFLKIFKFAGDRIAAAVKDRGGRLLLPPEGFFVKKADGPLVDGELQRARLWGGKMASV